MDVSDGIVSFRYSGDHSCRVTPDLKKFILMAVRDQRKLRKKFYARRSIRLPLRIIIFFWVKTAAFPLVG